MIALSSARSVSVKIVNASQGRGVYEDGGLLGVVNGLPDALVVSA